MAGYLYPVLNAFKLCDWCVGQFLIRISNSGLSPRFPPNSFDFFCVALLLLIFTLFSFLKSSNIDFKTSAQFFDFFSMLHIILFFFVLALLYGHVFFLQLFMNTNTIFLNFPISSKSVLIVFIINYLP